MAIKTMQLDDNGDTVLDAYARPTWLYGQDAINQIVKVAVSLVLGDWKWDLTRGVDRLGIMQRNFNRQEVITLLQRAIIKVSYITTVIDISLEVNNDRVAKINYQLEADGGVVSGSIET